MNNPTLEELQKENEELKEALTKIAEYMHHFMPEHFNAKNPKHVAMYQVYHLASHAIKK